MKRQSVKLLTFLMVLGLASANAKDKDKESTGGGCVCPGTTSASADASEYPSTTCPVGGGALDSMGGPYVHKHMVTTDGVEKEIEVRLCCAGCLNKFNEDPALYIEKVYGS
ncbi:MAG: hypothetical protein ACFCU3_03245 [Verrucomicrobiales bacterium]